MLRALLVAGGAGLIALAGVSAWPVVASDTGRPAGGDAGAARRALAEEGMSAGAVVRKLEGQGYTVREIEREDGAYEVYATDADGVRVELYADPRTGDILRRDDD
jgi:catechol 2,3-dioxygenase-like lactoylglutathione lyase family enzyme